MGPPTKTRMTAADPTRMSPRTSVPMINQDIPEDVICSNIFPCLPFKLVTCLKTISKNYYRRLTHNEFAAKQATLCPSCPALIHIGIPDKEPYIYSLDVLSTTPSIVGVPSSGLDFLGCHIDEGRFDLLASTNGLLCIRYGPRCIDNKWTSPPTMHVANPATQQSQPIPGAADHLDMTSAIGLVFDPLDDSQEKTYKFMIVQALPTATINDTSVEFHFISFSSDTGRWVMSNNMVTTNMKKVKCQKVVYSSGVLYWDYDEDLLWFDVGRSAVGSIKMPWMLPGFDVDEGHSIDVSSNGMLMCTTISKDGLAMYQLVSIGDYHWELKHTKGWESIMEMYCDEFQFCHSMKLRNGWQNKFYERWFVHPLGLESGRWVYIGVRQKWKTPDKVLRYDMVTGMVENTGKDLGNPFDMKCVLGYRNSMASLPPIFVPTLQDGICVGKSGGCRCAK